MSIIRTILGDIAPGNLGMCLPHEHLYGQPPPQFAEPDFILNDEAAVIEELKAFRDAGGGALVEMTTPDYGRSAAAMQRIARATGVHIIAATGHNKEKFSAAYLEEDVQALAERFVREVKQGMDGTDARAGVIKAASTLNQISPLAEKLFRAAAQAHRLTHAPVSTHTEAGTMALEQVAILTGEGVAPRSIIIGHTDRKLDIDYHLRLAAAGVYLGYDQIGKAKYNPDSERADAIKTMIDAGFGRQLLLAGDTARRSGWLAGGGGGFRHIPLTFVPMLRERGVTESQIDDLLIHNPAAALAFEPAAVT